MKYLKTFEFMNHTYYLNIKALWRYCSNHGDELYRLLRNIDYKFPDGGEVVNTECGIFRATLHYLMYGHVVDFYYNSMDGKIDIKQPLTSGKVTHIHIEIRNLSNLDVYVEILCNKHSYTINDSHEICVHDSMANFPDDIVKKLKQENITKRFDL